MTSNRVPFIDLVRVLGISLMVIFHFSYDLHLFDLGYISSFNKYFWNWFPKFIVFTFMLSMGLSLGINKSSKVYSNSFLSSQVKLFMCAFIISIGTYFLFPSRWVYFGTLHCILICRFLIAPIRRYPLFCLFLGVGINIPLFFGLSYPWFKLDHNSMDYIPVLPWLSYGLLGVYLAQTRILKVGSNIGDISAIQIISKNSLVIYMVHQPILYGLANLIHLIRKLIL